MSFARTSYCGTCSAAASVRALRRTPPPSCCAAPVPPTRRGGYADRRATAASKGRARGRRLPGPQRPSRASLLPEEAGRGQVAQGGDAVPQTFRLGRDIQDAGCGLGTHLSRGVLTQRGRCRWRGRKRRRRSYLLEIEIRSIPRAIYFFRHRMVWRLELLPPKVRFST